jgi:hypothetical protein
MERRFFEAGRLTGVTNHAYMDPMSDTARRSVALTKPQLSFLHKEAKRLGITVSDLIRRIIDQFRGA